MRNRVRTFCYFFFGRRNRYIFCVHLGSIFSVYFLSCAIEDEMQSIRQTLPLINWCPNQSMTTTMSRIRRKKKKTNAHACLSNSKRKCFWLFQFSTFFFFFRSPFLAVKWWEMRTWRSRHKLHKQFYGKRQSEENANRLMFFSILWSRLLRGKSKIAYGI